MTGKIKSSLFAKVFLLTALVLILVSFLVYCGLALAVPQLYSGEIKRSLNRQVQSFITELEQVTVESSGGLFEWFLKNGNIRSVELYGDDGRQLSLPGNTDNGPTPFTPVTASEEAAAFAGDAVPMVSDSFYFSFAGESRRYMLLVYGEAAPIAALQKSFWNILPAVLLAAAGIALVFAWLYSRMITRFSDLQSANEQLQKEIELEKEWEQAQRSFFSAASHELKTPVTIIKGQLEGMLLGIGAYKNREKYLARALETVNHLENMIEKIVTISKLEASGTDFQREPINCVSVIRSYLAETEELILQKELHISLDLPQRASVDGSLFLLEKVFYNLIGNAVKYAPHGAAVNIVLREEKSGVLFAVENTGMHIPESEFPKLFHAFYRIDSSRSKRTGGSGLGLYIVQKVLEQHGTVCRVRNTASGVQFYFTMQMTDSREREGDSV